MGFRWRRGISLVVCFRFGFVSIWLGFLVFRVGVFRGRFRVVSFGIRYRDFVS